MRGGLTREFPIFVRQSTTEAILVLKHAPYNASASLNYSQTFICALPPDVFGPALLMDSH